MNQYILSAIIGYLFGCIQTSFIIGKLFGKIDVREHGSQNAGGSNITTLMGIKWGIFVGLIDILKGYFAVLVVQNYLDGSSELIYISGAFAVLGHIFPFFMSFRGGKGVATLTGMFFAIRWEFGVVLLLAQIILSVITDYVAIGCIGAVVAAPILIWYHNAQGVALVMILVLVLIQFNKFWPNFINIRKKQETGIREVLFKKNV